MLTKEQHKAVVDSWAECQEGFRQSREAGISPHRCAEIQASTIRFITKFCGPPQHEIFTKHGVNPLDLASDLESGEFDQEIAAILGYV